MRGVDQGRSLAYGLDDHPSARQTAQLPRQYGLLCAAAFRDPSERALSRIPRGLETGDLMPADLQAAFDAVKAAVADGTLTQTRIDESVLRILTVKAEFGILQ